MQNWLNQTKPPIPLFGAEKVGINAYIVVGTDAKCTQKNTYADKELEHARERRKDYNRTTAAATATATRSVSESGASMPLSTKEFCRSASAKTHPSIPNLGGE